MIKQAHAVRFTVAKRAIESMRSAQYEELVLVLQEAREAAGLRHDELARRLGKGRTYIYAIEHYGRRVDPAEVMAIADALDLDPLEVFATWLRRLPPKPIKLG
jgi:transcriptional regulator with XRE-family HTH domain